MPSAQTVLETALLLLAAFLIGAVIGHLARRFAIARAAAAQRKVVQAPVAVEQPQPMIAPVVAPAINLITVPRKPTAAQRLAAAAGERPEPFVRPTLPVVEMPATAMSDGEELSPPAAKTPANTTRPKRATKKTGAPCRRTKTKASPDTPSGPARSRRSTPLKEPRR